MEKNEKEILTHRVKMLREGLHLSQKDFADELHLSTSFISSLESGKASYRKKDLDYICKICDLDPSFFSIEVSDDAAVKKLNEVIISRDHSKDGVSQSERLQKNRLERGLTESALAQLSGVSVSSISYIESGKTLTRKIALKLGEALNVGADYLLTGDLRRKTYPVNDRMVNWLWDHEEVRRQIWEQMQAEKAQGSGQDHDD